MSDNKSNDHGDPAVETFLAKMCVLLLSLYLLLVVLFADMLDVLA
jgi:hypothetical protein